MSAAKVKKTGLPEPCSGEDKQDATAKFQQLGSVQRSILVVDRTFVPGYFQSIPRECDS